MTYTETDAAASIERLSGNALPALTQNQRDQLDQFHAGGPAAVDRILPTLRLAPEMTVLDVGSGLGRPARQVARSAGRRVTVRLDGGVVQILDRERTLRRSLPNPIAIADRRRIRDARRAGPAPSVPRQPDTRAASGIQPRCIDGRRPENPPRERPPRTHRRRPPHRHHLAYLRQRPTPCRSSPRRDQADRTVQSPQTQTSPTAAEPHHESLTTMHRVQPNWHRIPGDQDASVQALSGLVLTSLSP